MKHFEQGQRVEIQRDVGADWEPATYRDAAGDHKGWHSCSLDPSQLAMSSKTYDGAPITSYRVYLPTQRIRLRGSGRDKYHAYWHLTARMLDMLESVRDTGDYNSHLCGQSEHGGANGTRAYLQKHGLMSWAANGWTLSPAALDAIAHRKREVDL